MPLATPQTVALNWQRAKSARHSGESPVASGHSRGTSSISVTRSAGRTVKITGNGVCIGSSIAPRCESLKHVRRRSPRLPGSCSATGQFDLVVRKWPGEKTEPVARRIEDLDALPCIGEHLCLLGIDNEFDHDFALRKCLSRQCYGHHNHRATPALRPTGGTTECLYTFPAARCQAYW